MNWVVEYGGEFWRVTSQLSPWLLLGCLLAGVMHVAIPADLIHKHLGGNRFANVVKAVLLGVPLPLCSCSVLPAGVALKKQGASDGAAVGFLISTPQTGVDSIAVSAAVLGWPFAVLKVVAATVTGLVGGWIANLTAPAVVPAVRAASGQAATPPRSLPGIVRAVLEYGCLEILAGIWRWVLIGLALSALVGTLVPEQSLAGKPWATGLTGMLAMLALGVPLYVCTTGSLPIAAALVRAGMSPGAALVFLMAGPATNAATIGAVWRVFGYRVTAVYLGTIMAGSMAFGWLFDAVVRPVQGVAAACHDEPVGWLGQASAGVFLALCLGLALRNRRRATAGPACGGACAPTAETARHDLQIEVGGLTCQHCARRLHGALSAIAGVTAVAVSHETGVVLLSGHGISRDQVMRVVRETGFEPR